MGEYKFTLSSHYVKSPVLGKLLMGHFITVFAIDKTEAVNIYSNFYHHHLGSWTGTKYSKCIQRNGFLDRSHRHPTMEYAIIDESGEIWVRPDYYSF